MLHHRQDGQNFNSVGVLEIPEVVLEELLQNALVHIDLLHPAAVRLLVFENRIEIINPGRLYGGLKVEDIRLGASKQRNPLMADFAARTMIFRGLGSGIVRALRENVVIDFVNEDEANQFRVIIWRTTQKDVIDAQRAEFTTQMLSATTQNKQKLVVNEEDLAVRLVVNGKKLTVKVGSNDERLVAKLKKLVVKAENLGVNLTANRLEMLKMIIENPTITKIEMAQAIGISSTAIDNNLEVVRDKLIRRVGSDKSGIWDVILE